MGPRFKKGKEEKKKPKNYEKGQDRIIEGEEDDNENSKSKSRSKQEDMEPR